jgi:hypothetical protein
MAARTGMMKMYIAVDPKRVENHPRVSSYLKNLKFDSS